jgi:hypothetical protein
MAAADEVRLTIHAAFDPAEELVGIAVEGSPAFEAGRDTRAMIEILAGIVAKANFMAAEIIRHWDAPDERRKQLVDHFAGLKEEMLANMLEQADD